MARENTIQIHRSGTTGTSAAADLSAGELCWVNMASGGANGKLYIGNSDDGTAIHIGGGGSGNPSGVSGTDNRLVRMDGTDGLQDTGITIADTTNNVSGMGTLDCGIITSTGAITAGGAIAIGDASMSESDLEKIDGVTNGTAAASKALVLDANKDIGTIRNLTIDGTFSDGNYTFDTNGNVSGLGTVGCGVITQSGATLAATYSPIAGSGSIATTGTVTSGTWQGTVVASAYLDSDTAHLTTTQTFSGAKTFSAASQFSEAVTVGVNDTGYDVKFFGDSSGSYLLWDESADALILTDSTPIKCGDSQDLQIYHNGTDSYITNKTGGLKIGTESSGVAITIGHGTSEVTVADNLTVSGDLSVTGTTTTVNQTNLDVSDNIIGLNRGASTNANDSGLIIERGSTGNNAAIVWDESADGFIMGTTTATPDSTGNLTIAKGDLVLDNLDVDGTLETDALTINGTASVAFESADATKLDNIETAATADQTKGDIEGLAIQTVGAVTSGSWTATKVASAYLDDDTAHLSTTQTFTGAKTFTAAVTIGADDAGHDVIFYGNAASANMTWDTSADDLIFNGAARIVIPDGQLVLNSTAVSSTAAELNIMDGGTAAVSTTVVDADRVVFNDNGTMKQVAVTDLAAYFDDEITAMPNLVIDGGSY